MPQQSFYHVVTDARRASLKKKLNAELARRVAVAQAVIKRRNLETQSSRGPQSSVMRAYQAGMSRSFR